MRIPRLLMLCVLPGVLAASEGAAWLKIPQGARNVGLGSALSAARGGSEAFGVNPAQVAGLRGLDVSFSRQNWLGDTRSDTLAFGGPLGWFSMGLLFQSTSAEDSFRDLFGNEGGKFSDSAWMAAGLLGARAGGWRMGLAGKTIHERYASSDYAGFVGDLGMQFDLGTPRVTMGAAVLNLGSLTMSGVEAPLTYRGGIALDEVVPYLLLALEVRRMQASAETAFLGGLEIKGQVGKFGLAMRGGFDSAVAPAGGAAGMALGAGIQLQSLKVDFAWTPYGALGSPYRMTLGWDFAAWQPPRSVRPQRQPGKLYLAPPEGLILPGPPEAAPEEQKVQP